MRVWRLSVAYIGPKSRTERLGKTKIGTEVAHVTRDSDTTFKVKRSKVNLQGAGAYCGGLPHSLLIYAFNTTWQSYINKKQYIEVWKIQYYTVSRRRSMTLYTDSRRSLSSGETDQGCKSYCRQRVARSPDKRTWCRSLLVYTDCCNLRSSADTLNAFLHNRQRNAISVIILGRQCYLFIMKLYLVYDFIINK